VTSALSSPPPVRSVPTSFVLRGWIEFECEGQGCVRLEAGSCVHQPPEIRHREVGHSEDIEMLEVVLPGDFSTEEVDAVGG
jgi:quercetin dioxygenase-like cupin family protein